MKFAKRGIVFSLVLAGALTATSFAQDDQGAKQDMKDAGHSTAQATKKSASNVKKATKKGVNKSAHATKKAAQKTEDKTQ